jgi:biotin synthase
VLEAAAHREGERLHPSSAWERPGGTSGTGAAFDRVLEMVEGVASLNMEVCTTLGMLTAEQARRLKNGRLTAYNHNLDTSEEFYPRTSSPRAAIRSAWTPSAHVADAGINVCCGGIVGMGESTRDRCALLAQLGRLRPHPESVPVNLLVRTAGTPLGERRPPGPDRARAHGGLRAARHAAARGSRLSAGRLSLSDEAQALCFLAGANSVFSGDKLLTSPNPAVDEDEALISRLGLRFQEA